MTNFKGSLLATTLLAGVAVSGPAFAQDAAQPAPADQATAPDATDTAA